MYLEHSVLSIWNIVASFLGDKTVVLMKNQIVKKETKVKFIAFSYEAKETKKHSIEALILWHVQLLNFVINICNQYCIIIF